MLNNFNKNIKKIIEYFPEKISIFTSKSVIYIGLAVYWGVIIAGTILQIN